MNRGLSYGRLRKWYPQVHPFSLHSILRQLPFWVIPLLGGRVVRCRRPPEEIIEELLEKLRFRTAELHSYPSFLGIDLPVGDLVSLLDLRVGKA